jgi:DNA-binding NarL/FixJ family response regulator
VIRVLVVDDHAVVRTGLAHLLAAAGDMVCVGQAADGPSALELVVGLAPDVVLLDLVMPGQDGVSVTRALRAMGNQTRILVLTAFDDPDRVVEAVRAGADGYLLKGSEAETVLEGVRAVAGGGAPLDPAVVGCLLTDVRTRGQGELLTEREREVLELLRQGCANKSIARRLGISERTVKAHVTHILQRLGLGDRTQAALWAERQLGTTIASDQF